MQSHVGPLDPHCPHGDKLHNFGARAPPTEVPTLTFVGNSHLKTVLRRLSVTDEFNSKAREATCCPRLQLTLARISTFLIFCGRNTQQCKGPSRRRARGRPGRAGRPALPSAAGSQPPTESPSGRAPRGRRRSCQSRRFLAARSAPSDGRAAAWEPRGADTRAQCPRPQGLLTLPGVAGGDLPAAGRPWPSLPLETLPPAQEPPAPADLLTAACKAI